MHNAWSYTVHTKRLNIRRYNQRLCYIIIKLLNNKIVHLSNQLYCVVVEHSLLGRDVLGYIPPVAKVITKTLKIVLSATLCDSPLLKGLIKGNYANAYVGKLRLTKQHIYKYHYWTRAEAQFKRRSSPRPCDNVSTTHGQIIIIIIYSNALQMLNCP